MLHVRPAMTSDLKLILTMIDEAAGWLRTKATDQWEKPWPSQEERDERIRHGLETARTWVVEDNGLPVATITCEPDAEPVGWTKSEQAEPAVYVPRLVVRRSHAAQGIGAELINWAGRWAGRQYGARWIRIDAWTSNVALHQYFENLGFWFVRFGIMSSPSAALFQKQTATISSTSTPRLMEQPHLVRPSLRTPDAARKRIPGTGSSAMT